MMQGKRWHAGRGLTALELRGASVTFSQGLSTSGVADLYWVPSERGLVSRACDAPSGRNSRALPAGAILVGRFDRKCSPAEFAEELDGLVASLATEKAA